MSKLANEYGSDGLVVLAVNAWDEDKADLIKFVSDKNLKQRVLINGREVTKEIYGLRSLPTVLWINPDGIVVDVYTEEDGEVLEHKTRKLLGKAG